jgi:hypothetical protein
MYWDQMNLCFNQNKIMTFYDSYILYNVYSNVATVSQYNFTLSIYYVQYKSLLFMKVYKIIVFRDIYVCVYVRVHVCICMYVSQLYS